MSNPDKHITPWSAPDVQKYLKGELSAREMHQLEKAALEDPFLADAIEGLSQRPAAPLTRDLDELQTRLDARVSKKNKLPITLPIAWTKIAAAIVLLLGLGFTAWYVLVDRPTNKLAKSEPQHSLPTSTPPARPPQADAATTPVGSPQSNATAAGTSDSLQLKDIASGVNEAPHTKAIARSAASAQKAKAHVPDSETLTYADAAKPAADTITLSNTRIASLDVTPPPVQARRILHDTVEFLKQFQATTVNNDLFEKKMSKDVDASRFNPAWRNQSLVYNGQVLDRNNRPLAGAFLLFSGSSNALATTNALGQFKLNLRPQDSTQQLTVALPGYMNNYLTINKLNSDYAIGNTIVLRENPTALSEVVVTGEGHYRSESMATAPFQDKNEKLDSFWIKVAPVTGRLAYLDYLQSAKKSLHVDMTIQGAEVVSFGIDPKGAPIDFKIEHSLSPAHDAGVIQLITEGARWKILRGKNVRAMIDVSFP